jgi:dihydrodipicolinate synthase/N-acetylneuraminate lyase
MQEKIAQLKARLLHGVAPAMATPVLADGYTVNTAVIPQLADFLIERGVSGLFVGGTTGEGILFATTERMRLHETAVQASNGRVPVIVHIGANQMQEAVALAEHAAAVGADAIAAIPPTFYAMPDSAIAAYYHTLAAAVPHMPLMLYDIPQMAINGISPELLAQLGRELPTLLGIKTSRGDAQIVRRIIEAAAEPLVVLAGNEAIALGTLAMGAHGMISGLSTAVPEPFVALTQAIGAGNLAAAQQQHALINHLLTLLPAAARIGAIKQIITERGIEMGIAVPPRPMPTQPVWPTMQHLL